MAAASPPDPQHSAAQARERVLAIAGETMGEIVSFWGFKASMGRIWALLYLLPDPLTADAIAEHTGLSSGAVSMSLTELQQWGLVDRAVVPGERKRHFRAETDVWGIVRRIFRERELRVIGKARDRFQAALAELEAVEAVEADEQTRFMIARLRSLLELTRIGYSLIETFAAIGMLSLDPIRGALSGGLGFGSRS